MSGWQAESGPKIRINVTPEILERRLRERDKPGEHLWIVTAAWLADPRASEIHMDTESLVTLPAAGCFKCEQPFSNRLARRPCRESLDELL